MQNASQAVSEFLRNVLVDDRSLGVLYGPGSSGKSALIKEFIEELPDTVAVADVDGTGLNETQFLSRILQQFGYGLDLQSPDDLLAMLKVIVIHLTQSHQAPVLIVRHINHMYPSCLAALCRLAAQRVGNQYALRIVLVSDHRVRRIINSPNMSAIAERLIGSLEHNPAAYESEARLIVTLGGEIQQDIELSDSRMLIGRSDFCDIVVDSQCVSRQHALLIIDKDSVALIDLKSKNGSFVNSIRVKSRVLKDNDIIAIGNHRIKIMHPRANARTAEQYLNTADTAKMKSIEDARRTKSRESLQSGLDSKKA